MNYYIIHNDYHLIDLENHISQNDKDFKIIIIPHNIDIEKARKIYTNIIVMKSIFNVGYRYLNPFTVKSEKKNIKKKMNITKEDKLFLYSEEEWLNHYIVKLFKDHECKVFLLEDGGLPNYIKLQSSNEKSKFIHILKYYLIKFVWSFNNSEIVSINSISYPILSDYLIDSIFTYFPIESNRKINVEVIEKKTHFISNLNEKAIIFINEPIYRNYIEYNDYIKDIINIMELFNRKFDRVYFKFHPRENKIERKKISKTISLFNKCRIIDENIPIEYLFKKYCCKYIASFHSAALLNSLFFGMQPIYLYYLCNSLSNEPVNIKITAILGKMNYNFLNSLSDLDIDYDSRLLI